MGKSKFFTVSNNSDMDNRSDMMAPSNNTYNNNGYFNQNQETFVYNSYPTSEFNNQTNFSQAMPQQMNTNYNQFSQSNQNYNPNYNQTNMGYDQGYNQNFNYTNQNYGFQNVDNNYSAMNGLANSNNNNFSGMNTAINNGENNYMNDGTVFNPDYNNVIAPSNRRNDDTLSGNVIVDNNVNMVQPEIFDSSGILSNNNSMNSQVDSLEPSVAPSVVPVNDPNNNASNLVPVNPVAEVEFEPEEELPSDIKTNLFSVLKMMFGMILTPGTTVIKNSKKYKSVSKAVAIMFMVSGVFLVLCLAVRFVVSIFRKTYNSVTGASSIFLDFSGAFEIGNYLPYILLSVIMTVILISVIALIYYASSFINSKGVHMGTYFMVSTLAMVPLISGVLIFYPLILLLSEYVALLFVVFSFFYTLISFLIGMNEVLTFVDVNKKILYNVLNLTVIFIIMSSILLLCFKLNLLILPEFNF